MLGCIYKLAVVSLVLLKIALLRNSFLGGDQILLPGKSRVSQYLHTC